SNEAMARRALLNHVPIPENQIYPMVTRPTPEESAAAYEELLRHYFDEDGQTLHLAMLGMGPDGHCASLFPGDVDLNTNSWVLPARSPMGVGDRVTMTPTVLCRSRLCLFEVAGGDKAEK